MAGYLLLGATAFWGLEGPKTVEWATAMYWTIMTITTGECQFLYI